MEMDDVLEGRPHGPLITDPTTRAVEPCGCGRTFGIYRHGLWPRRAMGAVVGGRVLYRSPGTIRTVDLMTGLPVHPVEVDPGR
jgi:hypothetical protein